MLSVVLLSQALAPGLRNTLAPLTGAATHRAEAPQMGLLQKLGLRRAELAGAAKPHAPSSAVPAMASAQFRDAR